MGRDGIDTSQMIKSVPGNLASPGYGKMHTAAFMVRFSINRPRMYAKGKPRGIKRTYAKNREFQIKKIIFTILVRRFELYKWLGWDAMKLGRVRVLRMKQI